MRGTSIASHWDRRTSAIDDVLGLGLDRARFRGFCHV